MDQGDILQLAGVYPVQGLFKTSKYPSPPYDISTACRWQRFFCANLHGS